MKFVGEVAEGARRESAPPPPNLNRSTCLASSLLSLHLPLTLQTTDSLLFPLLSPPELNVDLHLPPTSLVLLPPAPSPPPTDRPTTLFPSPPTRSRRLISQTGRQESTSSSETIRLHHHRRRGRREQSSLPLAVLDPRRPLLLGRVPLLAGRGRSRSRL